MGLCVSFPTKIITFQLEEEQNWIMGNRLDCSDDYLRKLVDKHGNYSTKGFVEYITGKHYESLGYKYTHRFGLFGGNKIGTFPEADEVLKRRFGDEFFIKSRTLYSSFNNIKFELPDLMIYSEDCSYVKFVEVKRAYKDRSREPQARGLVLLSMLLNCDVEVCEVREQTDNKPSLDVRWVFADDPNNK